MKSWLSEKIKFAKELLEEIEKAGNLKKDVVKWSIITLLFSPFLLLYRCYVISILWAWFVVPLGLPVIGLFHVLGLLLVLGLINVPKFKSKAATDEMVSKFTALDFKERFKLELLMPVVALMLGLLYRLFL